MVDELEKNLIAMHGQHAKSWFNRIEQTVEALCELWALQSPQPIHPMTFHYMVRAYQGDKPVVIKCGLKSLQAERKALAALAGPHMVQVLEYSDTHHALLLESLSHRLNETHEPTSIEALQAYANVVKSFPKTSNPDFDSLDDWLRVLDATDDSALPEGMLKQGLKLRAQLLSGKEPTYLLHGDLHMDNLLACDDGFKAIDPKGVNGALGFEIAAFDFAPLESPQSPQTMKQALAHLCKDLGYEFERALNWKKLRCVLGACWSLSDHLDPKPFTTRWLDLNHE